MSTLTSCYVTHVPKCTRPSLRFSCWQVKGHALNYTRGGGRAWDRGYTRPSLRFSCWQFKDHTLHYTRGGGRAWDLGYAYSTFRSRANSVMSSWGLSGLRTAHSKNTSFVSCPVFVKLVHSYLPIILLISAPFWVTLQFVEVKKTRRLRRGLPRFKMFHPRKNKSRYIA